ncbi:hypothetical protein GCM10025868_33740 [Angustibacter aerolatus]|uniref:Carbohydrate kinase PfkB domain-containing protein n=1 Tax=Angustibacter aerolatus TaxID=1162965 RepID=A0ABQ6JJQ7_9ACTN|nr:hypothetical protein GCM10025868_33740 [Angustibacter aerolatus]
MSEQPFDLITMGRIGVDLYPLEAGVPLQHVERFGRFLGGSATNVAVAAARHGRRTAVVTRTGADPFGTFVHEALRDLGVVDRWVTPVAEWPTPITFCEIFPRTTSRSGSTAHPPPPTCRLTPEQVDAAAVASARVLWTTLTGLSQQPSLDAHRFAWRARGRLRHTVIDLDWRPAFWPDVEAGRERALEAVAASTVAVGNRDECEVAVGERDPDAAAEALLALGVEPGGREAGPRRRAGADGRRARGGAGARGRGAERPGRGRRVRRGAGARAAGGLAAGADAALRQRGRGDRRLAAGVLDRDADDRRGRARAWGGGVNAPEGGGSVRAIGPTAFAASLAALTDVRARHPEAVAEAALVRRRRPLLPDDGRLLLVAADHPARGALGVRGDGQAMASRSDLLARLRVALARPGVDGVVATPDVVDDLLLLGDLDDRVVIGSMNRGGLQGAAFEPGRPVHRVRRPIPCGTGLRGRQDARAHRPVGRRLGAHAGGGGPGGGRAGRPRPGRDDRAVLVRAPRRPGGERPEPRGRRPLGARGAGARADERAHLAEGCRWSRRWSGWSTPPRCRRCCWAATPPATPTTPTSGGRAPSSLPGVRGLVVGRALLYPADDDVAAAVDVASGIVHGGAS